MTPTTTTCPTCKHAANAGRDNPWRPFCSERCKLVDLGRWLDGDYAIPGEQATDEPTQTEPEP